MQASAPLMTASAGLTPANAWIGPRVSPAYAYGAPNPVAYAAAEMTGAVSSPEAVSPMRVSAPIADPTPVRHDAPAFSSPAPVAAMPVRQQHAGEVATAPSPTPVTDPMAPRRDARIFQMQQPAQGEQQATAAPATSPTAGQNGSRYYSVHREAGRTPDPTTIPEPVYFDSVNMDLAQPPEVELPIRDAQGRRRVVANADPSLP